MAYFPNGTSGMCYEEQYCANCIHGDPDGPFCPIWSLHLLYNYEQCGKGKTAKTVREFLGTLIPLTPDKLGAEQCSMFVAKVNSEADEAERRRLAQQPQKYLCALEEMRSAA